VTPSNTPPHPPTTEDDLHDRLRLLRSRRVGVATYRRLLKEHGTARNALHALPEVARAAGVLDYQVCPTGVIEAEMRAAQTAGAAMLAEGDPDYPAHLHEIPDAQAGGVDVIYPVENTKLTEDIGAKGLRLSEMPMGMQPRARHFPARNRIISGLARAVVVVEAAAKSGSLITARNALDQARDVLAVPGHPFDARAAGCNMLIRDGAVLVRSAADVIEAIGPLEEAQKSLPLAPDAQPARSLRDTAMLHSQILARLGPSPVAEDQLIRDLAATATAVAPAIMDLELDGKITRQAGGLLARVE